MIITQKKPFEEVLAMLGDAKKVLVTGCAECATVCKTGGVEEVEEMKKLLTENGFEAVGSFVAQTGCNKLLTKKELKAFKDSGYDAIICMSCGDGTQTIAGNTDVPVYPANNTMFLGEIERLTLFNEACKMCGDCVLGETGGICPVTKCAKSLINGPCGGAKNGMCEVDPNNPCAWVEIYKKLKALGQLDKMLEVKPAKGYAKVSHPRIINLKEESKNE